MLLPPSKVAYDRAIGPHQGNVAAGILDHSFIQADPRLGRLVGLGFRACEEVFEPQFDFVPNQRQLFHQAGVAEGIGDPSVAEAVDGDGPRAVPDFDLLGFAGIARGEARHRVAAAIGDPDPILLIHGEVERPLDLERAVHGFAIHGAAQDAPLRGVSLRQIDDLALFIVERPHVAIRRGDDALHLTQLSAEVVAGFGGKRLAGVAIEGGNGFAGETGGPHLIVGADGDAEAGAVNAAAAISRTSSAKAACHSAQAL